MAVVARRDQATRSQYLRAETYLNSSPVELFTALGKEFKLSDEVTKHFVDILKLESLGEFALVFSTEEAVAVEVSKIKDLPGVQLARTKMAWQGVRDALKEADVIKRE